METVDDGGGTTDGAPVAPPRKKRATELTRQKLFHYMPTLHSSSSFWRDGWQAGLITRQTDTRTQSVRVWDFLWSEERKEWRVSFWRESPASLSAAVCILSVVGGKCCHLDRTRSGGGGNNFRAVYHIAKSSSSPSRSSGSQHPRSRSRSLLAAAADFESAARAPRFMTANLFRDFSH